MHGIIDIKESIHKIEVEALLKEKILALRSNHPVKILPERDLAMQLGVSRMSLRSAIKKLKDEGLLIQKQGSGTYISPYATLDQIHIFIAHDIKHDDPFYAAFMAEMYHVFSKKQISIQFIDYENGGTHNHEKTPLIIIGIIDESKIVNLIQRYKYAISIHAYPDIEPLTQINFDDYKIGYRASIKMIERGITTLVHLAGPFKFPSSRFRSQGFHDAAKSYKVECIELTGKMNYDCGIRMAKDVIAIYKEKSSPIGVFASNDWMALGLMHALKDQGIHIPREISIIGCDDIPLSSQNKPTLTTFRWDFSLLIKEILTEFEKMIGSSDYVPKRIMLNAQFVERDSLIKIS
jgi:DNA-binding LacI/PurR family transcriptional regulator/biotin operon repressor